MSDKTYRCVDDRGLMVDVIVTSEYADYQSHTGEIAWIETRRSTETSCGQPCTILSDRKKFVVINEAGESIELTPIDDPFGNAIP